MHEESENIAGFASILSVTHTLHLLIDTLTTVDILYDSHRYLLNKQDESYPLCCAVLQFTQQVLWVSHCVVTLRINQNVIVQ